MSSVWKPAENRARSQEGAHELKAAMNKEERIRVPETDKFDDDNVAADQPVKT